MPESSKTSCCPVCSSEQLVTLNNFSAEDAAQHFVCREGSPERNKSLADHIRDLWGGNYCSVRQCLNCEFGFSDPFVAGDLIFYNLAAERSFYGNEKWEYSRTVAELSDTDFKAERVLEVGAGFGFFLDKIVDVHVAASGVTALEFGDRAVSALRDKGYAAIQEDVRTAKLEPGFDAIFMFQVLEHLDNLNALFNRLHSLLRPGGLFFIAVPNSRNTRFAEQNGSLLDMPPQHIGRWSEPAIKTVGERHGLHLDRLEIQPFSLKEFVKTDVIYSYLRTAQKAGTLANWSRSLRSARYGMLLGGATAAAYAPRRVNVWRRAAKARIGGALWAEYRKTTT